MNTPPEHKPLAVLVGAGPGDISLITTAGLRWLGRADCVVYDRLANPSLLKACREGAEMIYVGKGPDRHEMTQEKINQLLVDKVHEGKLVVRLKGGDPFIFGRGSEECDALAAAGLEFRVVPGLTSSIAAGAFAGIPLTDRRCGPTLALVTGHEDPTAAPPPGHEPKGDAQDSGRIDWGALAKIDTVVFYMGVANLPMIARRLMDAGRDGQTPAAIVERASTVRQRTITGTLATIADLAKEANIRPPALTIVGQVVALRKRIAWLEKLPLWGKTILVTRSRMQASVLAEQLAELGAEVIESATIDIQPAPSAPIDQALLQVRDGAFDWLVLTSPNGTRAIFERMDAIGMDARGLAKVKIAAVGPGTAEAMRQLLIHPDLIAEQFTTESLAASLAKQIAGNAGKRVLLMRADIATPVLAQTLEAAGASVQDVVAYRTVRPASLPPEALEALRERRVHWITFTSSSTVENFLAMTADAPQDLSGIKLAAIGPVTAETLKAHGLNPTAVAQPHTIAALVQTILNAEHPQA